MPSPVRELLRLPTDHSRIPRGRLKLDWTCRNAMLESRALHGAVAQLGERRVRNAKVEGSIPFRSTNSSPSGSAPGCLSESGDSFRFWGPIWPIRHIHKNPGKDHEHLDPSPRP